MESMELTTERAEDTEALGAALAHLLPQPAVIALFGDLASGKTCLVRGMARHFAGDLPVHSPTFTLVNRYGSGPYLYHLDLYRLSGPDELADLGYEELFDPDGVCVVEWAERGEPLLPERRVDIHLLHGGGDRRMLALRDRGIMPLGWADSLRRVLDAV